MTSAFTPKHRNMVEVLQTSIRKFADNPLFGSNLNGQWQWISYRQYGEQVGFLRSGLTQLGVQAGDRVAMISGNRVEWLVAAHACYSLPAVYVPMYEAQLDKEWAFILRDCGAKVCFVGNARIAERLAALRDQLPELRHVIRLDGPASEPDTYASVIERGKRVPVEAVVPASDALAGLSYTSGTTGEPKGVMLTHGGLAAMLDALAQVVDGGPTDRTLAFLPWAHLFGGIIETHMVICFGASLAICEDTAKLLEYLPQVQPTILFAVPRIWNRIYDGVQKQIASQPALIQGVFHNAMSARSKLKRGQSPTLTEKLALPIAEKLVFSKIRGRFGGKLRMAISGSAALSRDVGEFVDNLGIQVYEGYGLTEGTGVSAVNRPGAARIGTVGKAIPGALLSLDRNATGAGEGEGELILHGAFVTGGYFNKPELSKENLTADGGLRTGDLARIDAEGFVTITGRVKELYKLENAKYVAPAPLEEKLQLSPYISQCMVYGANRPHNVALIIPDKASLSEWAKAQGITVSGDALLQDAKAQALIQQEIDRLGIDFKGFEKPKAFVLDGEEMTTDNGLLTPTLKLKRRNILAKYQARLDALYG